MVFTTFRKLKEAGACEDKFKIHSDYHGSPDKYGWDTPIPISESIEVVGLDSAIWALRCTVEPAENLIIEFACRCAEHVLHYYEEKYPDDNRPRQAIDAARVCITDKSAAGDAAWAAVDAAGAAAWAAVDAARAAAWAAVDAARAAAWAAGDAARAAGDAARAAAWAAWAAARAAGDAAWAARDAAWAARDAQQEWQRITLLELLNKEI